MATFRIIEKHEGEITEIASGLKSFEAVKVCLQDNLYLFDWLFEDDVPSFARPDFDDCETWQQLGEILEEIQMAMSWWGIYVQRFDGEDYWEDLNPRDTRDWEMFSI